MPTLNELCTGQGTDHVLIVMPTINELCTGQGTTIQKRDPEHLRVFKKLGETLAPMKPHGESKEIYRSTKWLLNYIKNSARMTFHYAQVYLFSANWKRKISHFLASESNLKKFPAYIAASIELTASIATLQNALHCL